MSFKNLFLVFTKNDDEKNELKKKIASLEMNMEELKKSLQEWGNQKSQETSFRSEEPPIIIEKINIEKIILDKYELNNNFGQLGIKELKGKLNIGATYGGEYTPKLNEESESESESERFKTDKPKQANRTKNAGPKVNIQTKEEK